MIPSNGERGTIQMGTAQDERGRRSLKAVALGGGWAATLISIGIWVTAEGSSPLIWLFVGPWAAPGILLAVWGSQHH